MKDAAVNSSIFGVIQWMQDCKFYCAVFKRAQTLITDFFLSNIRFSRYWIFNLLELLSWLFRQMYGLSLWCNFWTMQLFHFIKFIIEDSFYSSNIFFRFTLNIMSFSLVNKTTSNLKTMRLKYWIVDKNIHCI